MPRAAVIHAGERITRRLQRFISTACIVNKQYAVRLTILIYDNSNGVECQHSRCQTFVLLARSK
jgi:hypothetical protein